MKRVLSDLGATLLHGLVLALLCSLPALAQTGPNFNSRAVGAYTLGSFAPTTSAQLRGVLSDETGTGLAVFATSPTLSGAPLVRNGLANNYIFDARNLGQSAGQSFGLAVMAGTNSSDSALDVYAQDQTTLLFQVKGNGAPSFPAVPLPVSSGGTNATTARAAAASLGTWHVLCQSAVSVTTAADTTENTAYTCSVPAGAMGTNGRVKITALTASDGASGIKTIRIKFGGTTYLSYSLASNLSSQNMVMVRNRNSAASQVGFQSTDPIAFRTSNAAVVTSTENTANAVDVVLTCQKAAGAEAQLCRMDDILVEVLYGA